MLQINGDYDKYLPPYSESDTFIVVNGDKITQQVARKISDAFIFELSTSHGITLKYASRPEMLFSDYEDDDRLVQRQYKLFPLLKGKGVSDVISMYVEALSEYKNDYVFYC